MASKKKTTAAPPKRYAQGVRDWTGATIILDIENSQGEKFHFEIEPGAKDDLPTRASSSPTSLSRGGTVVNLIMPL